jgi:hypothetical protein
MEEGIMEAGRTVNAHGQVTITHQGSPASRGHGGPDAPRAPATPFLVVALLLLLAPSAWAQDVTFRSSGDGIEFNRFTVTRLPEPAEGEGFGRLRVEYAGRLVHVGELSRLDVTGVTLRLGLPEPGRATLLVTAYTGGAHCCYETSLFTSGPDGDEYARVDLADGPPPVENEDGSLTVLDWQFAYFASKSGSVSFSFAASPAMKRLLVHEAGGWRVDNPGEYKEFYRDLLGPLERAAIRVPVPVPQDNSALGRLMEAAYYRLMAGEAEKSVLARWRAVLPGKAAASLDDVFAEVVRAVKAYNPVVRETLPTGDVSGQ